MRQCISERLAQGTACLFSINSHLVMPPPPPRLGYSQLARAALALGSLAEDPRDSSEQGSIRAKGTTRFLLGGDKQDHFIESQNQRII